MLGETFFSVGGSRGAEEGSREQKRIVWGRDAAGKQNGELHEKQAVASRCTRSWFPAILQHAAAFPAKNAKMAATRV